MVKNQIKRIKIIFLGILFILLIACQPKIKKPSDPKPVWEPVVSVQDVRVILLCSQTEEHLSCQSKPVKAALKAVEQELLKAELRVFMNEEPSQNAAITSYLSISTDHIKRGDEAVVYVYLDLKAVDSATGQVIATIDKEDKFVPVLKEQNSDRSIAFVAKNIAKQGGHQLAEQIAMHLKKASRQVQQAQVSTPLPDRGPVEEIIGDDTNEDTSSPMMRFSGEYYALIIGINHYQYLKPLKMAVTDAQAVANVLKEQYGFHVTLLLNQKATRSGIMNAFNRLNKNLDNNDHLLIYYAGHGYYDKEGNASYWLPTNAKNNEDTEWINSASITTHLRRNRARNILVVADSCYSGTLTRKRSNDIKLATTPAERRRYLKQMLEKKSRVLIASGGNEPVLDSGGQGHSIFAQAFLDGLRQMNDPAFTAEELFIKQTIQERVAGKVAQTPEFQIIRQSGHDSGDFVFQQRQSTSGEKNAF
ncbi:MAG: hypothetical protein DRR19_11715 [Candidatus Parabeggiatoa sp. nov. 1]|nr:MAG: hypothetical protein DRR19_11715 [Gammaproteobacteria bacterium]